MRDVTVHAEVQVPSNRTYVGTRINGMFLTATESEMVLKYLLRKFWHLADVIVVGNFGHSSVMIWLETQTCLGVNNIQAELLRFTQALERLKVARVAVPFPLLLIHTQ